MNRNHLCRSLPSCVLIAVLAGGVLVDSGCAARRRAARGAQPATKVPAAEAAKYRDPVAVSALKERATALLVQMASDPSPQVRSNALEALADSPQRLEPLAAKALKDPNPGVRSTAAMMIGRAKLAAVAPATRTLLNDPSPFPRASAIYALVRCGQQVDQTPLAALLLNDPSPRVRSHAAYLLGELGDVSALELLRDAARAQLTKAAPSEMRLLQLQIAEAMIKLGDDVQTDVIRAALYPSRPEDLEAAALAVQIIGQVKDRGAIDHLQYIMAYRDNKGGQMPAEIRLGAAGSLAMMGLDQGAFIADEYIGNPLPALRAQAAFVYGQVGRTENLPRLEKLMADTTLITRVSAAAAVLKAGPGLAQQVEK